MAMAPSLAGMSDQGIIDLYDSLSRIENLDKVVRIPSLVVVGDQSAGKSSLLETVSGMRFPRQAGRIGTSCRTRVEMRRSEEQLLNAQLLDGEGSSVQNGAVDSITDLTNRLDELNTQVRTNNKERVADARINIRIEGPDKPTLTLIDLPGLVHNGAQQQIDLTHNIVRSALKPEEQNIVIGVLPANADLRTQSIVQEMTRYSKGDKGRFIVVFTKCDLCTRDDAKVIVDTLNENNKDLPFEAYAVVCGDNDDDEGDAIFQQDVWKEAPEDRCGREALLTALKARQKDMVRNFIPRIIETVEERLKETQKKLDALPPAPTSTRKMEGRLREIIHQVERLFDDEGPHKEHLSRAVHIFNEIREKLISQMNQIDFMGVFATVSCEPRSGGEVVQHHFHKITEVNPQLRDVLQLVPGSTVVRGPAGTELVVKKYDFRLYEELTVIVFKHKGANTIPGLISVQAFTEAVQTILTAWFGEVQHQVEEFLEKFDQVFMDMLKHAISADSYPDVVFFVQKAGRQKFEEVKGDVIAKLKEEKDKLLKHPDAINPSFRHKYSTKRRERMAGLLRHCQSVGTSVDDAILEFYEYYHAWDSDIQRPRAEVPEVVELVDLLDSFWPFALDHLLQNNYTSLMSPTGELPKMLSDTLRSRVDELDDDELKALFKEEPQAARKRLNLESKMKALNQAQELLQKVRRS